MSNHRQSPTKPQYPARFSLCLAGASLLAILAGAVLLLAACDIFNGPDLRAKAQADVALATAAERTLTITGVSSGSTSPAGTVKIKDGYTTDIVGNAQQEYVLIGWKKTAGTGEVSLTPVDTTTMRVALKGGDATIEPVYELRPVVLYSTPIGNNIAKNSSVRVVFNREVDMPTSDWLTAVNIRKQGVDDLAFTPIQKSGYTTVTFKPTVAGLSDYTQYVVSVKEGIRAKIDFSAAKYLGVTFLTQSVLTRSPYNNPFITGAEFDTLPPFNTDFTLIGPEGNQFYTRTNQVTLSNIKAVDDSGDSGVASVHVKNEAVLTYPETGVEFLDGMSLPWTLSSAADGTYSVSMLFKDINDNLTPETSAVIRSILIDATPPVIGSFSITPDNGSAGFVKTSTANLNLTAYDPLIGGSAPGSGESTNGADLAEQKTMRFSNDGANWSDWESYVTTKAWPLAGTDGAKTVYLQTRDGIGNVSQASAGISLDATSPSASITLSNGTVYTKTAAVTFVLTGSDSGSGMANLNLGSGTTGLADLSTYEIFLGGDSVHTGSLNAAENAFADGAYDWSNNLSVDLTLSSSDGVKPVEFLISDKVGNVKSVPLSVVLDTAVPTISSAVISEGSTTSNTTVTIAVTASDSGLSGLSQVGYQAYETGSANVANAVWLPYSASFSATLSPVSNNATQTVHVWVKDRSGNVSSSYQTDTIVYNTDIPTATLTTANAYLNASSSGNVSLSISASSTSNIKAVALSNNGSTWSEIYRNDAAPSPTYSATPLWSVISGYGASSAEGTRTVTLMVTGGNNKVVTKTLSVMYDITPPTISSFTLGGTGTGATKNAYALFNVSGSDNVTTSAYMYMKYSMNGGTTWAGNYGFALPSSGNYYIANTSYGGGTTAQGTKTVSLKLIDLCGNETVTAAQASIIYDTAVPVISVAVSLAGGASATNSNTVSVNATYTDTGGSGFSSGKVFLSNNGSTWSAGTAITSGTISIATWDMTAPAYGGTTANGTKTVYVKVTDNAGNSSVSSNDTITYDTIAPDPGTIAGLGSTVSRYFAPTLNATGAPTHMQFYQNGVYSGWLTYSTAPSVLVSPANGSKTLFVQYKDAVGNISSFINANGTLASNYNALNRNQIAYPTLGIGGENTSYITVGSGSYIVLSTTYTGPNYPIVFITESGKLGVLRYYLSGASIAFYYTTYNADGTTIQNTGTSSPSVGYTYSGGYSALTSGTSYYVNLDSATWNWATSNPYTILFKVTNYLGDMRIYYDGTNIYLYPLETSKFLRY